MLFVFRKSPKIILRSTIGRHFVVHCLGIAKAKNSICIRNLAKKTKNEVLRCWKLLKWQFKAFPTVKRSNLSVLQVGSLRPDTECSASLYRQTMNRLPWIGQRQLQLSKAQRKRHQSVYRDSASRNIPSPSLVTQHPPPRTPTSTEK